MITSLRHQARLLQLDTQAFLRHNPRAVAARVAVARWLRAPAQVLDPQPVVVFEDRQYKLRFPRRTALPATLRKLEQIRVAARP